jgi:ketosteroid isomerase-like protein
VIPADNIGNRAASSRASHGSMPMSPRRLLPPGAEMVKGRDAIEALWRANMQQLGDLKCTAIDVKPLGRNAAREIGTCSFKTKAQPPQDGALKYAVVSEKEAGQWKLLQDIWNTSK